MSRWSGEGVSGIHHRYDPLRHTWFPVNHAREGRPQLFPAPDKLDTRWNCPFCEEWFDSDRNTILSRDDNIYVIENAWPYAIGEMSSEQPGSPPSGGSAEVVVTTRHVTRFEELSLDELSSFVTAMVTRLNSGVSAGGYGIGFVNEGLEVGATIPHLHGQVMVLPYAVPAVMREADQAREGCIFEDLISFECERDIRLVTENDSMVAWIPWWMDAQNEMIIAPRSHHTSPDINDVEGLSQMMLTVAKKHRKLVGAISRRWVLHVGGTEQDLHWHLHMISAKSGLSTAGSFFEMPIQSVSPELYASRLREV